MTGQGFTKGARSGEFFLLLRRSCGTWSCLPAWAIALLKLVKQSTRGWRVMLNMVLLLVSNLSRIPSTSWGHQDLRLEPSCQEA